MSVQSETLLLADVFNNFWNMCLEICGFDSVFFFFFFFCKSISMPSRMKKSKLDVLPDIDLLLMTEKCKTKVEYAMLFIES